MDPDPKYKNIPAGTLFEFVKAPPRPGYNEPPRTPDGLLGLVGTVIDGPFYDSYEWGGLFNVLVDGKVFQYYSDFMKTISE